MHVIGKETSERLDVISAQYRAIVTHRPRLACRARERIVEVPAPERLPTGTMVASIWLAGIGKVPAVFGDQQCQGQPLLRGVYTGWGRATTAPAAPKAKTKLILDKQPLFDAVPDISHLVEAWNLH
jgi:zinc-finger binding domain of transposase IS66